MSAVLASQAIEETNTRVDSRLVETNRHRENGQQCERGYCMRPMLPI